MNSKTTEPEAPEAPEVQEDTFVETALRLSGKTDAEALKTGTIDRADDQIEALFAPEYQTVNSPVHRLVWDRHCPVDLFAAKPSRPSADVQRVMDDSMAVVKRHRQAGTLLNDEGKVSEQVFQDLATAGYWGMLVSKEFGGVGAPFSTFAPFLTRMATIDATVAGLASVHGCIGAVDPLRSFGTPEQQQRYLPKLASGERLSAFALTEPGAGSDLTALKTHAVLDGDDYVVNGEKLFITNAVPGRTIGLVCLIDEKPAVLIADLPPEENEHFQLKRYGLWALKHTYNNGLIFRDFRVPKDNLLKPLRGDGLTIAYHGLNLGRVALCAGAAGNIRVMLANTIPWAHYRETYGLPIAERELVRRRLARMAALIAGCDAMTQWCSWLLDEGYRGEMECVVAKIFGSESQKETAIELFMKTHGGRAFLKDHLFGDEVHEFLAPCIYEGEGEVLGMAFFKSLVKDHGKRYFEPIGKALHAAGIRKPNPLNPAHAWALKGALMPYARWWLGQKLRFGGSAPLPEMPTGLKTHAEFAWNHLPRARMEISATMRRHQLNLPDRQLRVAELSARVQDLVVILVTSLWGARQEDEIARAAADMLCQDLTRKLTGTRPSDRYFKTVSKLGERIAQGEFGSVAGLEADEILMPY